MCLSLSADILRVLMAPDSAQLTASACQCCVLRAAWRVRGSLHNATHDTMVRVRPDGRPTVHAAVKKAVESLDAICFSVPRTQVRGLAAELRCVPAARATKSNDFPNSFHHVLQFYYRGPCTTEATLSLSCHFWPIGIYSCILALRTIPRASDRAIQAPDCRSTQLRAVS